MDREPLAVVETGGPEYQLGNPVRIVVRGKPLSSTTDIEDAYRDAELINDAHEARVKEAVKKAVEEFRKKVVAACRDPWRVCQLAICEQGTQYGRGWYEGQWYMQKACSNAVADIPAEPEEAKP